MAFVTRKENSSAEARVLALFQSRAELKQEFVQLQNEKDSLAKLIDEQGQRIHTLESEMQTLEKHLGKLEHFEDIKVYYQLRRIWTTCQRYIHKFRDRMVDQQHNRERKQQVMEFNQQRAKTLTALKARIDEAGHSLEGIVTQAQAIDATLMTKQSAWHYWSRSRLLKQQTALQARHAEVSGHKQALLDERSSVQNEPWPEFENVDLAGKRSVNLAMIALAQFFYSALSDLGLHRKALEAQKAAPWKMAYGRSASDSHSALLAECKKKLDQFSQLKDIGQEVQATMATLSQDVRYTTDTDSLPDPGSLPTLPDSGSRSFMSTPDEDRGGNILTRNYWGVQDLLIP